MTAATPFSSNWSGRSVVLDFYRDVVQNITAWQPRAPRLATTEQTAPKVEEETSSGFTAVPDDRSVG